MPKGNLLIVDDNKNIIQALKLFLEGHFNRLDCLHRPDQIPNSLRLVNYDVVLLDMNFTSGINTGNEGIFWLNEIKTHSPSTEVVMITAYGDVELAVKALKKGACDFVLKPWDNNKLLATLQSALKLSQSNQKVHDLENKESYLLEQISNEQKLLIGASKPMLKLKQLVNKVAKTDANILLTGENGTGKEVIAKEIHYQSLRKNKLLVTVDMCAIPEGLIESELFGHTKGAFTDAHADRMGKFQLAHKGTLFLDEIGNIPLHLQSKLLIALQNRTITPVGSNKELKIDIRLISATNSNLDQMVAENQFREDFLFRINTINITIPPLRERLDDIELLANYFLKIFAEKYQKAQLKLSKMAVNKLIKYHWPGNVRELEHCIEKAVILSESNVIKPDNFFFRNTTVFKSNNNVTLEEMEKSLIFEALETYEGNCSKVANQLGISRQTLYNKMKKYDL